jgi:uncharacterized protein YndB with AHSA1/START domain
MTDLPTFRISHTVPLTPDQAYAHWTEPTHYAAWWGPSSVDILKLEMDVRPGGSVHYGMCDKTTGDESWGKWEVIATEPGRRLEVLNMFADAEGVPVRHPLASTWPLKTLAVTTFTQVDGGTRMDIAWTPYEASAEEVAEFAANFDSMTAGWSGSLATWDAYIATR